jgi:hypothetical protein
MPNSKTRKSSLTPTEKMRPSVAPTIRISSTKSSRKSSLSPTKSSMNLFEVKGENSLTAKSLTKLLKNLGIETSSKNKKTNNSFESLITKGFKTKK